MHEKLYSMKKELAGMLKNDRLLKSAVREVNKLDMIKGSLIVRNSNHETIAIDKILEGELQKDIPVKDYVFIENFCSLIRVAFNCLEMGNYLDKNFLISGYRILSEDENGYFRKSNPVLYSFNHVPVYSTDIEEKLDDAMRRVYSPEAGNNVVLKAMYIHNKLIDIYPFEEYSAELAVFAMNYYLMENGITPINMPLDRRDYFSIVADCLKGRRQEEFYNFLCNAVYDKMQGTIDACREYLKNNN
ncbi:MAG: Fic family protein [Bacillota bacterium]|nr:Fic family protein [Bacillota bacterium]